MTSRVPDWRIAAEAADWATRIDAGALSADERARLAEWLRASPVHVDELLFSASLMAGLAHVDTAGVLSIDDLLADTAPEVIPLFHGPDTPGEPEPVVGASASLGAPLPGSPKAKPIVWAALAASLLLVLALSWYGLGSGPRSDIGGNAAEARLFVTDVGEQRPFALEDGSILYMNADTQARVAFSDTRRLVELLDGEALFDVAHDRDRPFRVLAAGTVVQAVGTKFTVEHTAGTVRIVVMEGEVLVGGRLDVSTSVDARLAKSSMEDISPGQQPARLAAGQQAQFIGAGAPRIAETDVTGASGWQAQQLSFRDEGLSVIAAEFNRFNAVKIVITDPALARTRFSGVFDAHDPQSFVAFLELSADVRVERPNATQIVLTAAD